VRITAQLIDAASSAHTFDGSLEDVFDLQDKVALSVAGVIEPALHAIRKFARLPAGGNRIRTFGTALRKGSLGCCRTEMPDR